MSQTAWIFMYNTNYFTFCDLKKPHNFFHCCLQFYMGPCQTQLFLIHQNKLFVTSDQTSKQPIYIRQFIFAENALKEPFQKQMYSAERKQ